MLVCLHGEIVIYLKTRQDITFTLTVHEANIKSIYRLTKRTRLSINIFTFYSNLSVKIKIHLSKAECGHKISSVFAWETMGKVVHILFTCILNFFYWNRCSSVKSLETRGSERLLLFYLICTQYIMCTNKVFMCLFYWYFIAL